MVSTLVLFPLTLTLSPGVPGERGILCRYERKLRLLKRYDTITLPFQGGFNLRYILSLPKKDRILFHPVFATQYCRTPKKLKISVRVSILWTPHCMIKKPSLKRNVKATVHIESNSIVRNRSRMRSEYCCFVIKTR